MHSLRKTVQRIFDIREGELIRTLLMFAYLLLVIASYVTTKSVRDAMFLKKIGVDQLPYVFILIALVVGVISSAYSKAASRVSLSTLIRTTSLIAISNLCLFWMSLHRTGPWLLYVLYIWVSVFGVITASQFWLLANYAFNPREAKRLFGLVAGGGVLGGMFGGYFTKFGAHWFGTENLLLWCMGFMGLTILILERVSREAPVLPSSVTREVDTEMEAGQPETRRLLRLIAGSRHLTMLTAILAITVIVESFVDYQLKFLSDQAFDSQDQLTSFFGTLFAYLGVASLLFQILLTGRILKRFGVGASILFMPAGLFAGSVVLALSPSLWAVGFLKISDGSFRYSIHRSGIELLYLPVPMSIKNQVKGFIDMFIDRFGRGIGGLLLILFSQVIPLSISQLSLLVCAMIGVWVYLSIAIRKEYLNTFRLALEKKTLHPEMLRIPIADSATLDPILRVLDSQDERQVLYALSLLEDASPSLWSPRALPLIQHASPRVRALVLERLAAQPQRDLEAAVRQRLTDPDLEVRTEAVHYLCKLAGARPESGLEEFLHHPDFAVVAAAIRVISKHQWEAAGLVDQRFIEGALREAGRQREAARTAAAGALGLVAPDSPLLAFLKPLLEDDSLEVSRAAIRSSGALQSREALPYLVTKLADSRLRHDVREALIQYGERIVGTLGDYLHDPAESLQVRANIPKVLSYINSQEAVNVLVRSLPRLEPFLGHRAIKALNKMRVRFPGLSFTDEAIDLAILDELKDYYQFGIMLNSDDMKHPGNRAVLRLLRQALQERMDQKLERVFRLLGLRYPPTDIYSAYNGVRSQQTHVRASAIEFLDNLLRPDIKQLLFPILEESAADALLAHGSRHFGLQHKSRVAYIEQCIEGRDLWLQAISLYVAGDLGLVELAPAIRLASSSENPMIRQTAQRSLRLLEGSQAVV
jgi:AAA family ATP:ADP antiporter